MPAYLKLTGIEGEATQKGHEKWIKIDSVSLPIHRTISVEESGANRARGHTVMGDMTVGRSIDKSSVTIAEACASGKFYTGAEIDLCTVVNNKEEVVLKYTLSDVLITSYQFDGRASMDPKPTETITLNFTKIEWCYFAYDQQGKPTGRVPASFDVKHGTGSK